MDLGERELPGDEVDDGDHLGLGAVATSPAFGRLDERVLRWTHLVDKAKEWVEKSSGQVRCTPMSLTLPNQSPFGISS